MCGIAGIVGAPGEAPSREALEAMGGTLAHRGPDDATLAFYGRAGFSFRRLSIIDVAGGARPLHNEDRRCRVGLNGERYKYLELCAGVGGRGHRVRTPSAAETGGHGSEESGGV